MGQYCGVVWERSFIFVMDVIGGLAAMNINVVATMSITVAAALDISLNIVAA